VLPYFVSVLQAKVKASALVSVYAPSRERKGLRVSLSNLLDEKYRIVKLTICLPGVAAYGEVPNLARIVLMAACVILAIVAWTMGLFNVSPSWQDALLNIATVALPIIGPASIARRGPREALLSMIPNSTKDVRVRMACDPN
jgi:hypothetical protein